MKLIFLMIIAYLAGSVNFAILLFRILGKGDPRNGFSGNAGTTNVYRMAGPHWAALVLVLDVGRAVLVALLAQWALTPGQVPWTGLALVLGNRYPCFHGFQGGKGVANYLGFTAALTPAGAAVACLAWVAAYLVRRVPFIASFVMIAVLAIATVIELGWRPAAIIGTAFTALFIVYNHKKNIEALREKKSGPETPEADAGEED
ncbi:MAG: glycerol-3-phosphate acyltransferase [Spirochaetes bacterium]|nr:glycerol-3-phosphate acyltransferase [Spirochaetota bacterium]